MVKSRVYFRGYKLTPENSVKRKVYDNTKGYSMEEQLVNESTVVDCSYDAAAKVYNTHKWLGSKYEMEDFLQDAAVYILDKFRAGYFDAWRESSMYPIVYRLINGHFVYNGYQSHEMDRMTCSLNTEIPKTYHIREYIDLLSELGGNPEEVAFKEICAIAGFESLRTVVNGLNFQPFPTKKYTYIGNVDGLLYNLTEVNVGKLIIQGKHLHDILNVYGHDVANAGSTSQSAYIAKIVKKTIDKIAGVVAGLSELERCDIEDYLETF